MQDGKDTGRGGRATADPCVLVVEDDRGLAELLAIALADRLGCDILSAFTGEEGWRLFQHHAVAVVLTDHHLLAGGMTGLDLARRIKLARPGTAVLMFAGDPPLDAWTVCDRVFRKPLAVAEVLAATEEMLSRRRN
ncbi:MAG: response regulator [Armatimonadetes bacterium]|nr:response regulator [Armatimonadota bacterium]